jgi:hypothetical protein
MTTPDPTPRQEALGYAQRSRELAVEKPWAAGHYQQLAQEWTDAASQLPDTTQGQR